jgi:hypothetical protein
MSLDKEKEEIVETLKEVRKGLGILQNQISYACDHCNDEKLDNLMKLINEINSVVKTTEKTIKKFSDHAYYTLDI